MKIFFIGSVYFSRCMLEAIIQIEGIQVVGVATKSKSKFNSDHSDLSDLAIDNDIPYKYVKDINAINITEWISSLSPDVIYCFGWSSLIKEKLLSLTKYGVIGFHPAKLPQNRGRHPLIWALVLGLKETASTFFKMDMGADTGDILNQKNIIIEDDFTANDLYKRTINTAKEQLPIFTLELMNNKANWIKQDDSKSNYWRKRGVEDGQIRFSSSSKTICNLVRALSKPYVGAHLFFDGVEIKVWSCKKGPKAHPNLEYGKVIDRLENNHILIKTGDGSVWITEHEFSILPEINDYIL